MNNFIGVSSAHYRAIIESISGVFAHHYGKPQRRTPLSEAEKKSRTRFGVINAAVRKRIQQGDTRPRNVIWAEVAEEYDKINA